MFDSLNTLEDEIAMKQSIEIAPTQLRQQAEVVQIETPLYRKISRSDNWQDDVTLTRIADDGSTVSIRYLKAKKYPHETVEFSVGRETLDTGILDYTMGRGLYASSEPEFAALAALGARLLAKITQEVGPLPEDVAHQLMAGKQNGNQPRAALRQ